MLHFWNVQRILLGAFPGKKSTTIVGSSTSLQATIIRSYFYILLVLLNSKVITYTNEQLIHCILLRDGDRDEEETFCYVFSPFYASVNWLFNRLLRREKSSDL